MPLMMLLGHREVFQRRDHEDHQADHDHRDYEAQRVLQEAVARCILPTLIAALVGFGDEREKDALQDEGSYKDQYDLQQQRDVEAELIKDRSQVQVLRVHRNGRTQQMRSTGEVSWLPWRFRGHPGPS